MDIHRYQAASPAAAFELASRDASKWTLPAMEALADMAKRLREGYIPMTMGSGKMCSCHRGNFMLFDDERGRGFGISLVSLSGHEVGVADPRANELLEFHRSHRGEALFADQLIVYSEHISTLAHLDESYRILEEAQFLDRSESKVTVKDENDQEHERFAFICRPLRGSSEPS